MLFRAFMHNMHGGLTVIIPLQTKKVDALSQLLRCMNKSPAVNCVLKLQDSSTTLFASISILPAHIYAEKELPECLLIATSFCGTLKQHLDDLVKSNEQGLKQLFNYCEGWTASSTVYDFIYKHKKSSAFYSGMHGISVHDIAKEETLRATIRDYLNTRQNNTDFKNLPAACKKQQILNYLKGTPLADYVSENKRNLLSTATQAILQGLLKVVMVIVMAVPLTLIFLYLLVLASIEYTIIRLYRIRHQTAVSPSHDRLKELTLNNKPFLNELTAIGPVKKTWARRQIFIWLLKLISPFTAGSFAPIPTIATARWVAADKGKRLLFISNFANTADSYVRDFIDHKGSAIGINLLFGHGRGFPKTKFFFLDGALKEPEGFMNEFHKNQHLTMFWYCAYNRQLSVDNIRNNRKIRNGLYKKMNDKNTEKWLTLL